MKKMTTNSPHDAVFKQFLSHPDTARDFLDIHLPAVLKPLCDLSTLKLEPGSFIKSDLRAFHSDVIWSVNTTKGQGYIYVVIEHQSSPDPLMAFRLIHYAMEVMLRHVDKKHATLPLVIPMLFYHGKKSPYSEPRCWLECFVDPDTARQLYCGPFPLVDVTAIPDNDIMQHRHMALLEFIQKHIRQRDLMELLEQLASLLSMDYTTNIQRETLFNYMLRNGDTADFDDFIQQLAVRVPQEKERLMTIAERLHAKGWLEGQREGRQEGRMEEAQRIARMMLENGQERETVMKITGVSEQDLAAITA